MNWKKQGNLEMLCSFLIHILLFEGQTLMTNMAILLCKAKRQYLLTLQVSRYCLLALQSSIDMLGTFNLKIFSYQP